MSGAGLLQEMMAHAELEDGVLRLKARTNDESLFTAMKISFRDGSSFLLTDTKGMLARYDVCMYDRAVSEARISGDVIIWHVQFLDKNFHSSTSDLDSESSIVTFRSLNVRRLDEISGIDLVSYLARSVEDKRIKADRKRSK